MIVIKTDFIPMGSIIPDRAKKDWVTKMVTEFETCAYEPIFTYAKD